MRAAAAAPAGAAAVGPEREGKLLDVLFETFDLIIWYVTLAYDIQYDYHIYDML